jgi:hypothetical protein
MPKPTACGPAPCASRGRFDPPEVTWPRIRESVVMERWLQPAGLWVSTVLQHLDSPAEASAPLQVPTSITPALALVRGREIKNLESRQTKAVEGAANRWRWVDE